MKKGFTIVDTLVGLMIISVVVIALYLAFVAATLIQVRARQITIATVEAEKAIEGLRNKSYDDLTVGSQTNAIAGLPGGQLMVTITQPYLGGSCAGLDIMTPEGAACYIQRRKCMVDLDRSKCLQNIKQLTAQTSWQFSGSTRNVALETFAAKGGLNDVVP